MDNKNIEYELKAWAPLEPKLSEMLNGFKKDNTIKKQVDKYYDTFDRVLFKNGVFLRNRNNLVLDIKYNPNQDDNSHFDCEETTFQLPLKEESFNSLSLFLNQFFSTNQTFTSSNNIDSLLKELHLENFVTIDKERETYRKEGVEFCIDSVVGLGKFIEIECTEHETSKHYIDWTTKEGVKPIPVGYVELYLRQHDFNTYLTGRYLLEEDRP
ncbi:MAG TPA: CYTH domain-containing protein [Saprospiraceae bacterium]|nr:CYTH domain-containing protein [Saprospiraceae bacterium]